MIPVTARLWVLAACFAVLAGSLWLAYSHGRSVESTEWQARWNDRNAADNKAQAVAEAAEREKEQARQHSLNKAIQDGQKVLDQAHADLAAARADNSVRRAADDLAAKRQASSYSCTTATSAAATRAVLVLADVFKRADERAGDLAGYADESRSRAVICEGSYGSLR